MLNRLTRAVKTAVRRRVHECGRTITHMLRPVRTGAALVCAVSIDAVRPRSALVAENADFATLIWPTSISKSGPPATLTGPCRSQRDRGGLVGQESPRGVIRRDSTGVSVRRRDD